MLLAGDVFYLSLVNCNYRNTKAFNVNAIFLAFVFDYKKAIVFKIIFPVISI